MNNEDPTDFMLRAWFASCGVVAVCVSICSLAATAAFIRWCFG